MTTGLSERESVGRAPGKPVAVGDAAAGGRLRHALETSPFPILLVSLVGIVLLSVFGPSLVVGDTWLTLMAGREVVEHGLPSTETITVLGRGATWTDQQWLAQVVFYGAHGLAGMRAVVLLDVLLVLLALAFATATARTSGASSRSTFLVGLLAVLAGPWGWTIRAQSTALPLYAGALWLLVDASRRGVRRRTLLVLPLLVLWANLHGSVVLGAGLTVLLGAIALVRARRLSWLPVVLVLVAPLCVLASPYGTDLVAYYNLMLVDAPFAPILREWQWSSPSGTTALFWLLALVAVGVLALGAAVPAHPVRAGGARGDLRRGRAGGARGDLVRARLRGDPPGRARRPPDPSRTSPRPSVNRAISVAALAGLGAAALVFSRTRRPGSLRLARARVAAVRRNPRPDRARVRDRRHRQLAALANPRPTQPGRVRRALRALRPGDARQHRALNARRGDWTSLVDGYRVVVADDLAHLDLRAGLRLNSRNFADGRVERLGENQRLGVLVGMRQMLERRAQREELAERIPAQIAFFLELLDVLGRRAAGAGLEHAAARQQRNDRQHLGRGAELHDREQVGQVIPQNVAGDGNRVLALANPLERKLHRVDRRQNADVEPLGILVLQVRLDLGDELGVVRAILVEPEHGRGAGEARAAHTELDPVPHGSVLELAHAEDVAGLDRTLQQYLAIIRDDANRSGRGNFERLVVRAVFLGFLRHQGRHSGPSPWSWDRTRRWPCSPR